MGVEVTARDVKHVPHERTLRIVWSDQRQWRCHLEHGFGFMGTVENVRHDLGAPPERQGIALAEARFDVEPRETGVAYVSGLR